MSALLPGTFLVLAFLVFIGVITWWRIDRTAMGNAERQMFEDFEREMSDVELKPWNGLTYEWPESWRKASDVFDMRTPSSIVSGPLPELDMPMDTEAFIESLKAQTDAFLAAL